MATALAARGDFLAASAAREVGVAWDMAEEFLAAGFTEAETFLAEEDGAAVVFLVGTAEEDFFVA